MKLRGCHWGNNFVPAFYFVFTFPFVLSFYFTFARMFTTFLHLNVPDVICLASARSLKVEAEVTVW